MRKVVHVLRSKEITVPATPAASPAVNEGNHERGSESSSDEERDNVQNNVGRPRRICPPGWNRVSFGNHNWIWLSPDVSFAKSGLKKQMVIPGQEKNGDPNSKGVGTIVAFVVITRGLAGWLAVKSGAQLKWKPCIPYFVPFAETSWVNPGFGFKCQKIANDVDFPAVAAADSSIVAFVKIKGVIGQVFANQDDMGDIAAQLAINAIPENLNLPQNDAMETSFENDVMARSPSLASPNQGEESDLNAESAQNDVSHLISAISLEGDLGDGLIQQAHDDQNLSENGGSALNFETDLGIEIIHQAPKDEQKSKIGDAVSLPGFKNSTAVDVSIAAPIVVRQPELRPIPKDSLLKKKLSQREKLGLKFEREEEKTADKYIKNLYYSSSNENSKEISYRVKQSHLTPERDGERSGAKCGSHSVSSQRTESPHHSSYSQNSREIASRARESHSTHKKNGEHSNAECRNRSLSSRGTESSHYSSCYQNSREISSRNEQFHSTRERDGERLNAECRSRSVSSRRIESSHYSSCCQNSREIASRARESHSTHKKNGEHSNAECRNRSLSSRRTESSHYSSCCQNSREISSRNEQFHSTRERDGERLNAECRSRSVSSRRTESSHYSSCCQNSREIVSRARESHSTHKKNGEHSNAECRNRSLSSRRTESSHYSSCCQNSREISSRNEQFHSTRERDGERLNAECRSRSVSSRRTESSHYSSCCQNSREIASRIRRSHSSHKNDGEHSNAECRNRSQSSRRTESSHHLLCCQNSREIASQVKPSHSTRDRDEGHSNTECRSRSQSSGRIGFAHHSSDSRRVGENFAPERRLTSRRDRSILRKKNFSNAKNLNQRSVKRLKIRRERDERYDRMYGDVARRLAYETSSAVQPNPPREGSARTKGRMRRRQNALKLARLLAVGGEWAITTPIGSSEEIIDASLTSSKKSG